MFNTLFQKLTNFANKLSERLWFKPALYCFLAVLSIITCYLLQLYVIDFSIDIITADTVNKMLTVISGSMLSVATFSVGSMISAYASASSSATPRAFALILADDSSQNAFSSFLGAFIFSVNGLIAIETGLFDGTGIFLLFVLTLFAFMWVIGTFIFWVDQIARLGQIQTSIDKTRDATESAIKRLRENPYYKGQPYTLRPKSPGLKITATEYGYAHSINMERLNEIAESVDGKIVLEAIPGNAIAPGIHIATLHDHKEPLEDHSVITKCIYTGRLRRFENDPENGFIVLSEVAGKALSPGINDPGTALNVIDVMVQLLMDWFAPKDKDEDGYDIEDSVEFERVFVRPVSNSDLFKSAFEPIIRYGQGDMSVIRKLQGAFRVLKSIDNPEVDIIVNNLSQVSQNYAIESLILESEKNEVISHAREIRNM